MLNDIFDLFRTKIPYNEQTNYKRIVGGVESDKAYEWMAYFNGCGGTLIAPQWILTADHCGNVDGQDIFIGGKNLYYRKTSRWERRKVIKTIKIAKWGDGDMSLLKLNKPSNKTPIILNSNKNIGDLRARNIGWGGTNGKTKVEYKLRTVDLNITSRCRDSKDFICSTETSKGSCHGDSGGPIFVTSKLGDIQIGVVSHATSKDCYKSQKYFGKVANMKEKIKKYVPESKWSYVKNKENNNINKRMLAYDRIINIEGSDGVAPYIVATIIGIILIILLFLVLKMNKIIK